MRSWLVFACILVPLVSSATARAETVIAPDDPLLAPPKVAARTLHGWDDVRALAETRATDLRVARADRERAEGEARAALAAVLPQLSIDGTAARAFVLSSDDSGAIAGSAGGTGARGATSLITTDLRSSLSLVQPVVDVAAWYAIGTAATEKEAARLSLADARRRVLRSAAQALLANVAAARVADLARADLRGALERAALVARRRQLESATDLDVLRARQDVHAARLAVLANDEARRRAEDALGLALGVEGPLGIAPDLPLAAIAPDVARECPADAAVDARPDIAAQRARVEVAQRRARQVGLERLPSLRLIGEVGAEAMQGGGLSGSTTFFNASAVVSVPIWDGGAWYGTKRARAALADVAAEDLAQARRQAMAEIAQTGRGIDLASAAVVIAREAQSDASDLERLERERFRRGAGTTLELTLAAAALRRESAELARREVALVEAQLLARLAVGVCSAR